MYRAPAELPRAKADSEYLYFPRERSRVRHVGIAASVAFIVFVLVDFALSTRGVSSTLSALVGLFVASAVVVFLRRMHAVEPVHFRVDGSSLEIRVPGGGRFDRAIRAVRTPLSELLDVTLDTNMSAPVVDETSATAVRFADSRSAPSVELSRIVLRFRDGTEVPLTHELTSHLETAEAFGKLRVFLRKHDWRPADEVAA